MYIRIQNNAIRYRISKDEAQQLIDGESLIDTLFLSKNESLTYTISPTENASSFDFISLENKFLLSINKIQLINEVEARPSKSGIDIDPDSETDRKVFLEIDIKKSKQS